MSPALTAQVNQVMAGARDAEDGGMHGITGIIGGMGAMGNGFSLSMMQGLTGITMGANTGTQFVGMSGIGMMGNGLMVTVDAMPQSDGSWAVSNVQWRMAGGGRDVGRCRHDPHRDSGDSGGAGHARQRRHRNDVLQPRGHADGEHRGHDHVHDRRDERRSHELKFYDAEYGRVNGRGGQCLSHVSLKLGPKHELYLTAVYRYQFFVQKALGNFKGLARLQACIAREVGIPVGPFVCHATLATLEEGTGDGGQVRWGRRAIETLVTDCGAIVARTNEKAAA